MSKLEIIKELECLIAFQSACLNEGNWCDFDRAEEKVRSLETAILVTLEKKE